MKKIFLIVFAVAMAIVTFDKCKKDTTTSYQPSGNYAIAGANNNTVQSYSFNIPTAHWIADSVNLLWKSINQLPASLDLGGAVLLYSQDSSNWAALPHVDYGWTYEFGYDPTSRIMQVQVADSRGIPPLIPNPGNMNFKVVCIPTRMCQSHPDINNKNYRQMASTYSLININ